MLKYFGGKLKAGRYVVQFLEPIIAEMAKKGPVRIVEPFGGLGSLTVWMARAWHDKEWYPNVRFLNSDILERNTKLLTAIQQGVELPETGDPAEFKKLQKQYINKTLDENVHNIWMGYSSYYGIYFEGGLHQYRMGKYRPTMQANHRRVQLYRHLIEDTKKFSFVTGDYKNIQHVALLCSPHEWGREGKKGEQIFFLMDPPYEGFWKKRIHDTAAVDQWLSPEGYQQFWDFVRNLSKHYPCYVHEYSSPPDFQTRSVQVRSPTPGCVLFGFIPPDHFSIGQHPGL